MLGVLSIGMLLSGGTALADRVRCDANVSRCRGTERDDVITGSQKKDVIFALGGADQIAGRAGNDRISGGAGDDLLFGEDGTDTLDGDVGADRIVGGDGADTISGGSNSDEIDAVADEGLGPIKDTIECGTGTDTVKADRLDVVAADCEIVDRV
jgi:Ca2+-binding RTX toxin-like protein